MFDVSKLLGRFVERPDGPAEIIGAALVETYWPDGKPRCQELRFVLLRANGQFAVESADGQKLTQKERY